MKTELLASLAFGFGLVLLGTFLIRSHLRAWRGHRDDGALEAGEIRHYRAQFHRRLQVSFLLVLLGILIPAWDILATWGHLSKGNALLGIIVMLLVALWIMLLAVLDWYSSRVHRRALLGALASLSRKRRELEEEVNRLRQQRRNGRG